MALTRVTPASVLPVSIELALRHVRAMQEDADLVALYVGAATELVEDYTGRAIANASYLLQLEVWPPCTTDGTRQPGRPRDELRALPLRRTPILSVESVKYWPQDGTAQITLDPSAYSVDLGACPGRVVFTAPPSLARRFDAVEIAFTAGYGTNPANYPKMLTLPVLMLARHFFDNKIPVGDVKIGEMPFSVRHMLRAVRV